LSVIGYRSSCIIIIIIPLGLIFYGYLSVRPNPCRFCYHDPDDIDKSMMNSAETFE